MENNAGGTLTTFAKQHLTQTPVFGQQTDTAIDFPEEPYESHVNVKNYAPFGISHAEGNDAIKSIQVHAGNIKSQEFGKASPGTQF